MGRRGHKNRDLAKYLFVERGITDLDELSRMTGIASKTLERYRAADGWLDLQEAREEDQESTIESLDDVADAMIRLMLLKAGEIENLPAELADHDKIKDIRHLVETIKLLTTELRRMSKRDKLLLMKDFTDYCLRQEQAERIEMGLLNQVFELVGGYSDEVLEG